PHGFPSFGKEGCPKDGVVGRYSSMLFSNIWIYNFTYHLPLRGLLLPEGGESKSTDLYRTDVNLETKETCSQSLSLIKEIVLLSRNRETGRFLFIL
ncbi:hypothetical protein, partial [Bacteroides caecimuris]|uniref:hypothetical protein n=1 Tax=Bacteroides caecimuris TaxID=1796613 RepID=UPI0024327307